MRWGPPPVASPLDRESHCRVTSRPGAYFVLCVQPVSLRAEQQEQPMNTGKHGIRLLGAFTLLTLSAGGFAQSAITFRHLCIAVGNNAIEPLADRAGQTLAIGDYVCTTEGGPLDGATMTGRSISHYDGP